MGGLNSLPSRVGTKILLSVTVGEYSILAGHRGICCALMQSLGIGGDDKVDQFLQLRQGPDGIDGTADDFQFGTAVAGTPQQVLRRGSLPPEVQTALGLNQQQFQQIQSLKLKPRI